MSQSHNRNWSLEFDGAYAQVWSSDKGDRLVIVFEGSPRLNGTKLPEYGEDLEEVLDSNDVEEILKS